MSAESLIKRISTRIYYLFKYRNPVAKFLTTQREKAIIKLWQRKIIERRLSIATTDETINNIVKNKKSIARFGDGELRLLLPGENLYFQDRDERMVKKLREALDTQLPNLIIALNEGIIKVNNLVKPSIVIWWKVYLQKHGLKLVDLLPKNRKYGNANITRFYIDYNSLEYSERIANKLKQIWHQKDILIVEGEYSRLGIGNDLFANARSLERIICPSKNAFSRYDAILKSCTSRGKYKLIIIALGPTATVLAYDLAKEGFWALDMGHIDVEYMWMKLRAKKRVSLPSKAVAESQDRDNPDYRLSAEDLYIYEQSIVKKITCNE